MLIDLTGMTSTDPLCPVTGGKLILSKIQSVMVLKDGDCLVGMDNGCQLYPIPGKTILDMLPKEDFLHIPKQGTRHEVYVRKSLIVGLLRSEKLSVLGAGGTWGIPTELESEVLQIIADNDR